ncbi:right-handed parallel beta-helix repeat-containing protein [Pseudoxanthomonas japonensis]|uniref:right-handed parallel beta-helix repeat-containing protein n=1 Tax=Pseudoxanthomonas japonensis TaxID=69284 RepID=UPI0037492DBB
MAIAPLRPRSLFPVLLLSAGLCVSVPALSAEYFVSTSGNDSSGTGTLQNPYRTVKRAISAGRAGDTITLRAPANNRTYNECDVRLRQKMTLQTYAGEGKARIHCAITTPETVTIQIDPAASGSRLSNLEISGGYYYGIMLQTNWYQGGPATDTGASDVVLEDLLIHSTGRDGIKITPKSNRATIRRVEIHTTGARDNSNADGIDNVNADGMLVEDSYIHDTATTGMYFKGGARDVVVQRNRVENTGDAGILVGFDTSVEFFDLSANPQYYESIRGIVRNNVVRNTGYSGIGMYASKDAIVANNTIINAGRLGHSALYFGVTFQDWDPKAGRPANTNPTLRNNLVIQDNNRCVEIRYSSELGGLSGLSGSPNSNWNGFNNGCVFRDGRPGSTVTAGTLAQWRSGTGADANSKQAAFSVDATGHLPAGSPAIDAGTTLAQVTDDIDGQARSAPFDLGADEYGQQSTAPIRVNGVQPLVPVRGTSAASTPVTAGSLPSGSASAVVPSSTPATTTAPSVSTAKPATTRPAAARQYTPPAVRAWRWLLAWVGWLN